MLLLERIIGVIAPHECLGCGREGSLLCTWCLPIAAPSLPDRCYNCHTLTIDSRVCTKCRRQNYLQHVWVRTGYDGLPKQLVQVLKFGRSPVAAESIAKLLTEVIPYLPRETIVVAVPTATSRVRQRGYDHARMIAKHVAGQMGVPYHQLLVRTGQSRQVGASRIERKKQLVDAFRPAHLPLIGGASILLVDDVVTTGATLESAARALKLAGAARVDAVVFAQKQ